MTVTADINPLWPRWMAHAGAMLGIGGLLRSRCCQCGTELRVDLADIIARHGPAHGLIDRLERCRRVGCAGSTYYLAARAHDRPWTVLLRDPELIAAVGAAPAAQAAHG